MGAGAIISVIASFALKIVKAFGIKALLYTSFTLLLPCVLYNVFTRILSEVLTYASSQISASGVSGTMIQLTGMGGWIATQVQLPAAMSLFLSAVACRFVISFLKR